MQTANKFKQLANKALVRLDRSDLLSADLKDVEGKIEKIRAVCESTVKRVKAFLHGKDGSAVEKRIKKVPEFILGDDLVNSGFRLGLETDLGDALNETGKIAMKMGQAEVEFELKVEEQVLKPLQFILDNDIPQIYELKKNLIMLKITEALDKAKDPEDSQKRIKTCEDKLATTMYKLVVREAEIAGIIAEFLKYQRDYHKSVFQILHALTPS